MSRATYRIGVTLRWVLTIGGAIALADWGWHLLT